MSGCARIKTKQGRVWGKKSQKQFLFFVSLKKHFSFGVKHFKSKQQKWGQTRINVTENIRRGWRQKKGQISHFGLNTFPRYMTKVNDTSVSIFNRKLPKCVSQAILDIARTIFSKVTFHFSTAFIIMETILSALRTTCMERSLLENVILSVCLNISKQSRVASCVKSIRSL